MSNGMDELEKRRVRAQEHIAITLRWLFFLCVFGVALGAVWLTILAYRLAP